MPETPILAGSASGVASAQSISALDVFDRCGPGDAMLPDSQKPRERSDDHIAALRQRPCHAHSTLGTAQLLGITSSG